ncbi:hypothetical protein DNH61_23710 [Paenibacillus sambharensis]|uniref:Preprotein translocase subunit Tim44 n=1 Tax=Paenibacillus sambharensis TaxID=1803190 RepID=A0A2W1LF07_9BACL|nr:hypothetical protein [Paenibacillus sambharensis]PZD93625.1 hypothetical protein DNH61_23710 [Paenibacillus sambharensis]
MKKIILLMMALTVFVAFSAVDTADAKRGGFKSPKKSYTQTPSKPADNVRPADPGAKTPGAGATAGAGAAGQRGFFSGGGLFKGMMIGGLAGLMFGSMFAGMGFMGDFLGLLVNVLALYVLFVAIRAVIRHFRNRRDENDRRPY